MRISLVLAFVLAIAACGKKTPAKSPASAAPPAGESERPSDDMKDKSTPDDADEAQKMRTSDPCEGGE